MPFVSAHPTRPELLFPRIRRAPVPQTDFPFPPAQPRPFGEGTEKAPRKLPAAPAELRSGGRCGRPVPSAGLGPGAAFPKCAPRASAPLLLPPCPARSPPLPGSKARHGAGPGRQGSVGSAEPCPFRRWKCWVDPRTGARLGGRRRYRSAGGAVAVRWPAGARIENSPRLNGDGGTEKKAWVGI